MSGLPVEQNYSIEGLTFGDAFITINYSDPSDVNLPHQALFQQLMFNPMTAVEGVDELLAEIVDACCQIVDLLGVARRAPASRIRSGGTR